MSVKNFKFVSPGVFINEIDNSFLAPTPPTIGPVIIGRSEKGLAMTPVKVENYRDFVDQFGETVPGRGGGDVYRNGNNQSPMYGTYAAKAFLQSQIAPITYVRLLGQQSVNASTAGQAGWQTNGLPGTVSDTGGGAYGLFVAKSSSMTNPAGTAGTGSFALGAVFYADKGTMLLSGAILGTEESGKTLVATASLGAFIKSDSNGNFKLKYTQLGAKTENFSINLDDSSQNFVRKKVSTNPTLLGSGSFYPSTAEKDYWLGESYEVFVRDTIGAPTDTLVGIMLPLGSGSATNPTTGPMRMRGVASTEAKAGWFISQDVGPANEYLPQSQQKLFRLKGRGHGAWLHKNAKVQIDRVRAPASLEEEYGSFSVIIRALHDTDANPQILERFDNLNLDPTSPNFISKMIGDVYYKWDEQNQRLRQYGNYENLSKYVYVELNDDVEAGATNPALVPFGYFGPPKYPDVVVSSSATGDHRTTQVNVGPIITAAGADVVGGIIDPGDAATATIVTSPDGADGFPYMGGGTSIVLTAADDTTVTVTLDNGAVASSAGVIGGNGASTSLIFAQRVAQAINATTTKMVASPTDGSSQTITVTQVTKGAAGNKSITAADTTSNLTVAAAFTGGGGGTGAALNALSGGMGPGGRLVATLKMPFAPLVVNDTDSQVTNRTDVVFGMRSQREATSTAPASGLGDMHRMLFSGQGDDPSGLGKAVVNGQVVNQIVDGFAYVFSMDDIVSGSTQKFFYASGSRRAGTSLTATASNDYRTLVDFGYDSFCAPFFGGSDGFDITKPDPLANSQIGATSKASYPYFTYRQALEMVADPELLDFNVLAVPGLTKEGLTTYQADLCQERRDALAIIDLPDVYTPFAESYVADKTNRANRDVPGVVTALRNRRLDNSYACTFYPWVQTRDARSGQTLWVPPSVAMMGVLGSSQAKSDVWFAPAGFNRGGLSDGAAGIPITNASSRLSSKERDQLYDANINPIASFPSTGIVVFGQKTLQIRRSALDRINVRRLVIYLKKQISILSTQILFEQNVQATWDRFKGLIEPFLANVKTRYGLTEYRLVLDETTTTPDLIDQNILYAKIMIKPARAIEFIAIDFIIANTGASFDD